MSVQAAPALIVRMIRRGCGHDLGQHPALGGFDDRRLSTLNPSDTTCSERVLYLGYYCTGGELNGRFATDLVNKNGGSVLNLVGDTLEQIANLALFGQLQSGGCWSGTEYAPDWQGACGFQSLDGKEPALCAVAVHPGRHGRALLRLVFSSSAQHRTLR